jgi:hypothetical protein
VVYEGAAFETANPIDPGELSVEVMVQARSSARPIDNFQVAIGGSQILQAEFTTNSIFSGALLPATALVLQKRHADIIIRKNLTSSERFDAMGLLRARELIAGSDETDERGRECSCSLTPCKIPLRLRPRCVGRRCWQGPEAAIAPAGSPGLLNSAKHSRPLLKG